jgi:hypothetical protein
MTHEKILALLAGCSSANPMPFDALAKKSGLLPDTLRMVLEQLQHSLPAPINTAMHTKGGKTQTLIWPTGVVGPFLNPSQLSSQAFRRDQEQRAPADVAHKTPAKVQPNTSIQNKEQPMSTPAKPRTGAQPSELSKAIYNKIVASPGINEQALIKHALQQEPNSTEKQDRKALQNLRHAAKKVHVRGERGNYTYHPGTQPAQQQTPAKPPRAAKAKHGKVVTGPEAAALRGDPQPEATPAAPTPHVITNTKVTAATSASVPPSSFSVMLSDENHLHLTVGDEQYMLTPEQTARLHKFMCRVHPLHS